MTPQIDHEIWFNYRRRFSMISEEVSTRPFRGPTIHTEKA